MRLSARERTAIVSAVERHFGPDVQVLLFGSRTKDEGRGGDIDLLVESTLNEEAAFRAKIAAITDIQLSIGDQKIDLITCPPGTARIEDEPLIVRNARRDGIAL